MAILKYWDSVTRNRSSNLTRFFLLNLIVRYTHKNCMVYTIETVVDSTIGVIVGPTTKFNWTNYRTQLAQQLDQRSRHQNAQMTCIRIIHYSTLGNSPPWNRPALPWGGDLRHLSDVNLPVFKHFATQSNQFISFSLYLSSHIRRFAVPCSTV